MLTKLKKMMILLAACGLSISSATAQTWPPAGMAGDGLSEATAWQITTLAHLEALAAYVNAGNGSSTNGKFYKMMNNINLAAYNNWDPIGNNGSSSRRFRGNFDGNNNAVQNITINSTASYNGLFGYANGGSIKNLGVENCNITGGGYTGGLIGQSSSIISNCYTTGIVNGTGTYVGGLVENSNSSISNCYSTGNVTGIGCVGGLTGSSSDDITNCYATGNVNGTGNYVGGLVGSSSLVTNCYATGDVTGTGDFYVGGLAGRAHTISCCYATGNVNGTGGYVGGLAGVGQIISNCYATGDVTGTGNFVGGLVGSTDLPQITYCYATGNVNGKENVGGLVGRILASTNSAIKNCVAVNNTISGIQSSSINRVLGYSVDGNETKHNYANSAMVVLVNGSPVTITDALTGKAGMGKTLTELKTQNFYTTPSNWYNNESWDFTTIWTMTGSITGFPILQWQTGGGTPPTITTTSLPDGVVGAPYPNTQLTATGSDYIFWFHEAGSGLFPYGLSLSTDGVITGTPTIAGVYTFSIRAANDYGEDIKPFSITITTATVPPIITTPSLPDGIVGTKYPDTQLAATGTSPITWTKTSGNLPNGLTLSSAGKISGTPTTAGTFNFVIKAENGAGSNIKDFPITITTSVVSPTIITYSLPDGIINKWYNAPLEANGTAPIKWTKVSGNLPSGLILNEEGSISGIPIAVGKSDFKLKASNSAGSATREFSIVVSSTAISISGKIKSNDPSVETVGTIELIRHNTITIAAKVHTASDGSYTIPDITEGTYIISADPYITGNFYPTYYGNTPRWVDAEKIIVTGSSSNFTNMDITVPKLLPTQGKSLLKGRVYILPYGPGKGIMSGNGEGNEPAADVCMFLEHFQTT